MYSIEGVSATKANSSSFHVSLPTARLSSQGLIAINNYTSSAKGPDGGKDGSAMGEAEELAGRAWARLGGRGENQAIVFLWVLELESLDSEH